MNNNSDLQMFISACCANCLSTSCEGALKLDARSKCFIYNNWKHLSPDVKSKVFLAAMAGELINLERITDERRN